jgi:hypothetical protein
MLTKVLTHAKPASAPAASFTSIRSSVPQGNGSFMEPPVEQDFSRERLCQPAPSVSVASGSSPEDAANRAADTALARRLLSHLAKLAGEKITPAGPKQTSGQWLDANTAAIGRTFAKLDKMGLQGLKTSSIALERSHVLLEEYFTHSPTDVTPEPTGKVVGLPVDTGTNQIEADCDVYAAYAARLLREQGWDTAGYMSILPHEKKPSDPTVDRDAHAVALARRPAANNQNEYLGVSNSEFRNLGTFADDKSALPELLKLALDIYDPPLQKYGSYYLPGATGGGFDSRLLDPVNKGLTPYSTAP